MTTATDVSANKAQATPWWLLLVEGIALILLGILFLAQPGMTAVVTVQLLGIYWLLAGIINIVTIIIDSSQWGWKLIVGIIELLAGLVVLRHPLWSTIVEVNEEKYLVRRTPSESQVESWVEQANELPRKISY